MTAISLGLLLKKVLDCLRIKSIRLEGFPINWSAVSKTVLHLVITLFAVLWRALFRSKQHLSAVGGISSVRKVCIPHNYLFSEEANLTCK